jgi:hypothetical protein
MKAAAIFPEEDVTDEIVEIADADSEKDVPGNQLLDDGGRGHRPWRPGDGDQRDDQPDDEESEREVRQDEGDGCSDEVGHGNRRVTPRGSIDKLPRLRAQLVGVLAEFVA